MIRAGVIWATRIDYSIVFKLAGIAVPKKTKLEKT